MKEDEEEESDDEEEKEGVAEEFPSTYRPTGQSDWLLTADVVFVDEVEALTECE